MTDEKAKLLEAAISQIEKSYGKGSIMRLGSKDVLLPVNVIPSACLSIHPPLRVCGFPGGRELDGAGEVAAEGDCLAVPDVADFQRPDSGEDWRDVRQAGNDQGWARAEVLCFDARGYPAHPGDQGWGSCGGLAHAREDCEKQG